MDLELELLGALELKKVPFVLLMSGGRTLGLTLGFAVIVFVLKRNNMIRLAFSFAVGLPVALVNLDALNAVLAEDNLLLRLFLPVKELAIGFIIGIFASLPFFAYQYAGAISDAYRGENSNTLSGPGGDQLTTTSLIFFILLGASFIANNGFMMLIGVLYGSYEVWPLTAAFPALSDGAAHVLISHLMDLFMLTLKIGAPLLGFLFFIELTLMIAGRLAKTFGVGQMIFLGKNLVIVLVLPIYCSVLLHVSGTSLEETFGVLGILEEMFE